MGSTSSRRHRLRSLVRLVSLAALLIAVVKELQTPRDRRTWQGSLGPVPYDLRRPSVARLRAAYWNPQDERLFPPRPMGVGWAVNVGRVVAAARR